MILPNPDPRPPGELEQLEEIWKSPSGWRLVTDVNNAVIGMFYVGAALLFFVLAGILALLMRTQLAVGDNDFLGEDIYNQFFTTHGTAMMFLFAVPVVEAVGVLLLPILHAARDLPFPRLSAYAFWAYFIGGLVFFASLFFKLAPDAGWFLYPPLSSTEFSPGINQDFWLLGIGFIEISAIAGAIELIVGILRTRAPGMSLDKMPVYSWAMLMVAGMIVFAFPAVILATALLELERAFGMPFFAAERGGNPLLWQHLFWFFGHPEVYIIFLPAAGFVSMIVATMAGVRLVGYQLVVLAIIGTSFLSFGLWMHHMFGAGSHAQALGFFSAASMAVSIPSGIQVFAWIATIAAGRLRFTVPSLFLLGFLFIFVLGGLSGIMVAMVPFDWQAHDTYFVVAHLHYVLIGGLVFPLFAAIYYWAPATSDRPLSETLGRWAFWLIFIGVNVTFFPMHIAGLMGLPRRVATYPRGFGWDWLNTLSTIGSYVVAAGVLVFLVDMARNFRPTLHADNGNYWGAGTLEWLPTGPYSQRSIPRVDSREPLWDRPELAEEVEAGHWYLPNAPTGRRETVVTSTVRAEPEYLLQLPGPGWAHFIAAVLTASCFMLLTVKAVVPSALCGVGAVLAVLWWMWESDPGPRPAVDIGGGIKLPVNITGTASHSWWATVVLMIVAAMIFACLVFSYVFLWAGGEGTWPPDGVILPQIASAVSSVALYLAALAAALAGRRFLTQASIGGAVAITFAMAMIALAWGMDFWAILRSGLGAADHAYGAVVYTVAGLQGFGVAVIVIMALFLLAKIAAGRASPLRRATYDNTALLMIYIAAQGLAGVALVHFFPRIAS